MKPHLPLVLLASLLSTFVAQSVEIPDNYEQIDLWTPSYLEDYTSNASTDSYAFWLYTDLSFTPTTSTKWSSSAPLVKGGNLVFASSDGYAPFALSFSDGKFTVFEQPSNLTFDTLSNLTFSNQISSNDGSAIDLGVNGTLIISNVDDGLDNPNNADVLFLGNKITSSYGGAIYNGQNITIDNNGYVKFHGNIVGSDERKTTYSSGTYYSSGGAINTRSAYFVSNKIVEFSENKVLRDVWGGYNTTHTNTKVMGGALHLSQNSLFDGNAQILFNRNVADSCDGDTSSSAFGGAIHTTAELIFINNDSINFKYNKSNARVSYPNVKATAYGGAIYSASSLDVFNNCDVIFNANSVHAKIVYTGAGAATLAAYGGAIYSEGVLNISNNDSVQFINNTASNEWVPSYSKGGAIYSSGQIYIVGNTEVVFEKNKEMVTGQYSNSGDIRFRSIYSTGDKLILSAKSGGHITFYDTVYMGNKAGATVSFNADYEDVDGVMQKAGGDIIFSGKYTADHLAEVKGSTATTAEIMNSQTSEINNLITLYGGSLQVVDGAKLNGRGLTVTSGSGAKLLLRDGSMSHSGYNFTFNSGATLELQGLNTITASKVSLGSGSVLTVTVGEKNLSNAALALRDTDLSTSQLTVNLNREDGLTSGMYKIISQNSASDFTTKSAWTAENVTVNGSGYADRASFSDLVWENGTLYYKVGRTIWGNGSGDYLWNTASDNWTMNDRSYTYLDGMDVTFTDLGAGNVQLAGDIAPADIIVTNGEGNDYTFSAATGGGRLTGSTAITKNGAGALTLTTANTHTGATKLNEGTLNVHHSTALGATANGGTATVTTLVGTTFAIDNNSHVVLAGENSIAGVVNVAAGSSLEMQNKGYAASASSIDGTLSFIGETAGTTNAGSLTGSGTVSVINSNVTFASQSKFTGNLTVQGTNAKLSITSGNYNAAGMLEANGNGATLNLGTNNVTIKADGQIKLASEVTEANSSAAKLKANNVTISKEATLTVKGTEYIPVEVDGTINNLTLAATYALPVLNSKQVGIADVAKLTFNSGATYEALYGNLGLNNGELTLAVPSSFADKIHLEVRFDGEYSEDAKLVLFTDAGKVNFIYNGETVTATGNQTFTLNAADYFDGAAINDNTKVVFESGTVYLTEFNKVIPEPTTATLSMLALAGLAMRRRRK